MGTRTADRVEARPGEGNISVQEMSGHTAPKTGLNRKHNQLTYNSQLILLAQFCETFRDAFVDTASHDETLSVCQVLRSR